MPEAWVTTLGCIPIPGASLEILAAHPDPRVRLAIAERADLPLHVEQNFSVDLVRDVRECWALATEQWNLLNTACQRDPSLAHLIQERPE